MSSLSYKNSRKTGIRAKALRKEAPIPERLLWGALSALRTETGLKFRRQHPLPPYFADFACVKTCLIVELDGASHNARQAFDAQRDIELQNRGWMTMRFSNEEIANNLDGIVAMIVDKARERMRG